MGNVSILYKIMPESVDLNIDDLKNRVITSIEKIAKVRSVQIVPIAFGLSAIKLAVVTKDDSGISDKLESTLKTISGVKDIIVDDITLI